jgi:2-oxoglutarate decarboxylase
VGTNADTTNNGKEGKRQAMRKDDADFGPNDWLIQEMYRRYLDEPSSVSEDWQDFFSDYQADGDGAAKLQPDGAKPRETPAPEPKAKPKQVTPQTTEDADVKPLTGADAVIVNRMEESLEVPTATSVRTIPARLLEVNRLILNRFLERTRGGKVSFTHLIGFAILKALGDMPAMNTSFAVIDGKPSAVRHKHVNLGLAVDVKRKDGSRTLLVPNIKSADTLDFATYLSAYEDLIRKTHAAKLSPDDFAGTTVTITNPGTLGTVQSVPRLMSGQAAIIGVGAIGYPAEWQAADPQTLADIGVGKVITLTSTYDHRVIQGAESGEFLGRVHQLLLGEDRFYEELFRSMRVPYVPARWHTDVNPAHDSKDEIRKQARVLQIINQYRVRGHLIADLDPLETKPPALHPELDPNTYGLTIWDLDRDFVTGGLGGKPELSLGDILGILRDAYCRTASVEYMHIAEPEEKQWIQQRVEGASSGITTDDQQHILHKLEEAELFENFLHQKYVGHRRFSLEGAESLIPILDSLLDGAADSEFEEVVMGMTHRGRLNVLATIIGKSYEQIFREFEGDIDPNTAQGSGDVKYHLGASGKHASRAGNQVVVSVASNPSHLESVDPVVEGVVRAKLDLLGDGGDNRVMPVLIHGDAAFAGQGVVAETLALSQLDGYRTEGTIHIVVNNQLGFTTGSDYGRSSTYATDVAKMVQAPILHVNGDDPEACVRVARLAFDFRREFHKDVVIDMWCYRRWGHNETDEPSFTQPLMYARIKNRRSVRKLYTERLVNRGDLSLEDAEKRLSSFRTQLQEAFDKLPHDSSPSKIEKKKPPALPKKPVGTAVDRATLDRIVEGITRVPDDFNVHPKLAKWLGDRQAQLQKDAVDWSLGEALAFGSLVLDGVTVRLSGQDSRRGTFSQRHSALVDQENGREYVPLANLDGAAGRFIPLDSLLSEFAVLGFEYGYSVGNPQAFVAWEAQFGDFTNGAQVIVDEFISSAESKWGQSSRVTLLLPHGYEGQGPDHSSARLERFLQMAGEDNMSIVVPSTPAQYFHALRRQVKRDVAKPAVIFTPKSLLRLPAARSKSSEFSEGDFVAVIPESEEGAAGKLIFCQGKVYYDLLKKRGDSRNVALIRLEEPYPFPSDLLKKELDRHSGAGEFLWVQDEPQNMGAWTYVERKFREELGTQLEVVARPEGSSPATGSLRIHQAEQEELLDRAIGT